MTRSVHNLTEVAALTAGDRLMLVGANGGTERIIPFEAFHNASPVIRSITSYGAVGDDSTLNDTAIAEAIEASDMLFVPTGVYKVSEPIVVTKSITIIGSGSNSAQFKANATDFDLMTVTGDGPYTLNLSGFMLQSAKKGLRIDAGLSHGSSLIDIYATSNIETQIEILNYCYLAQFERLRASGGQKGIRVSANTPTQGSSFHHTRVSNTTIAAIELINPNANITQATFRDTLIEGNKGAAVKLSNFSVAFDKLHLESNGKVTGEPDIIIDNPTTVISRVELRDISTSALGAEQDGGLVRFDDTHIHLDVWLGAIPSNRYYDGQDYTTGSVMRFWGRSSADVRNFDGTVTYVG